MTLWIFLKIAFVAGYFACLVTGMEVHSDTTKLCKKLFSEAGIDSSKLVNSRKDVGFLLSVIVNLFAYALDRPILGLFYSLPISKFKVDYFVGRIKLMREINSIQFANRESEDKFVKLATNVVLELNNSNSSK